MELELQRYDCTPLRTIGRLLINGVFESFSLEDCLRPPWIKVYGETCIPAGRYEVKITPSQRFGVLLPILLHVPNFEGIRIDAGNTSADTSGCILVGWSRTIDRLVNSKLALAELQAKLATALAHGERVWITITNPSNWPGDAPEGKTV